MRGLDAISESEIRYILDGIVFCPSPFSPNKVKTDYTVEHTPDGFRIRFHNASDPYEEKRFNFDHPELDDQDRECLDIILQIEEIQWAGVTEKLAGLHVAYLKLIHFFVNEYYFVPQLETDKHGRLSSTQVRSELKPYLELPVADILITLFLRKHHFNEASLFRKHAYFTSDFDIIDFRRHIGLKGTVRRFLRAISEGNIQQMIHERHYLWQGKSKAEEMLRTDMFVPGNTFRNITTVNICFHLVMKSHPEFDVENDFATPEFKRFLISCQALDVLHALHPNYDTPGNTEQMLRQVEKFREVFGHAPVISRNHYLKGAFPENIAMLKEAGVTADATFGFHDSMLFRGGITRPFVPWDKKDGNPLSIIELPLTLMEGTLKDYMKLQKNDAVAAAVKKTDRALKLGTTLCLLWHNRSMYRYGVPGNYYPEVLEAIIRSMKEMDESLAVN
ncbi:MAG: hypothetical protein KDD36_02205 [Flavobacteriales bacterium]|nr:hypothetical protein [Flavobacteriales bacterium]